MSFQAKVSSTVSHLCAYHIHLMGIGVYFSLQYCIYIPQRWHTRFDPGQSSLPANCNRDNLPEGCSIIWVRNITDWAAGHRVQWWLNQNTTTFIQCDEFNFDVVAICQYYAWMKIYLLTIHLVLFVRYFHCSTNSGWEGFCQMFL